MKRVGKALWSIQKDIEKKHILEVACGCAEFSIAAAEIAEQVWCMDIEDTRVPQNIDTYSNVRFMIMDARAMAFEDEQFDTVILYNAIGHLTGIIPEVIEECMRVAKSSGSTYVISSSKMDKAVIQAELLPYLHRRGIASEKTEDEVFLVVRIL